MPSPASSDPLINEDGHVLKSRRGLLAAGLAVAVVGTIGVASTVNAGAEEIAAPPAAAPAAVAAEQSAAPTESDSAPKIDLKKTPPALLPWGSRPHRIKKGRPGISSKALRATDADVAPADAAGSIVPKARYGPKGRSNRTTFLKSEVTEVVPPEPAPTAPPPEGTDRKVNYIYNVGSQAAEAEGAYATMSIAKPKLDRYDYHTLAELAVQSGDGRQIVEIGWNVDRVVNGDDDPHLFVYHWVHRQTSCYNGCGFVQVSKNVKPGDTLAYGVAKKFGIQFIDDAWWVAYDSEWIGYFPETLWTDQGVKFNRLGLVQVFGEVAASDAKTCTEMGTGKPPKAKEGGSAYITNVGFVEGPLLATLNISSSNDHFAVDPMSARTFRYGGPTDNAKMAAAC